MRIKVTPEFGGYSGKFYTPKFRVLQCTNHMMFTFYIKNKDSDDTIIFGDGNQGKVNELGKIAITTKHSISNAFW
jgi:hypothetical protein